MLKLDMRYFNISYANETAPNVMPQFHSHEYYELDFLLRGERSLFVNSKMYNFEMKTVSVTMPFDMHKYENKPYERILLCVSEEYVSFGQIEFLRLLGKKTVISYNDKAWNLIVKILKRLLALSTSGDNEKEMKISLLLGYLLFVMHSYKDEVEPITAVNAENASPITLKVVDYIKNHLSEPLSLDMLCGKFHVSKSWLNRNFNKDMNCSVIDYYIKMKINRAKFYVAETLMPFTKISDQLGFSSANYFSIIFKKHVGYSPQQYRKNFIINRRK